jgi:hypothetical protein
MRNTVIGAIFFMILILSVVLGFLLDNIQTIASLGFLLGLGTVLIFRRRQ